MIEKMVEGMKYFQFENINNYKSVLNFISTRDSGSMAFVRSDAEDTRTNLRKFFKILDIQLMQCIFAKQVHGDDIRVVESVNEIDLSEDAVRTVQNVDSLITNKPGICIVIKIADCTPILLFDPDKKVVAAVHAGWKGTLQHIARKTVQKMQERFGSDPANIIAGIGPSLGPEDFLIRSDVQSKFEAAGYGDMLRNVSDDQWLLDIWEVNKDQLTRAGIGHENIEISGLSTFNSDQFFSYRKKNPVGHFIAGILIK